MSISYELDFLVTDNPYITLLAIDFLIFLIPYRLMD